MENAEKRALSETKFFSSSSAIFCVSGMRMPKEKNIALSIIVLWIHNMSLIKNVVDNLACCYAVTLCPPMNISDSFIDIPACSNASLSDKFEVLGINLSLLLKV